jgi:hypothetical protein
MIVVEGPDGGGKTTLIKEIQANFPVTIAPKIVGTQGEALTNIRAATEERVRSLNQGVVFDRHPVISGPIYHVVLGGPTNAFMFENPGWLWAMIELFYRAQPTIIYCIPPRKICLEDNANSWPDGTNHDDREAIYDLYLAHRGRDFKNSAHYDYTEGSGHMRSIMGYISRGEFF